MTNWFNALPKRSRVIILAFTLLAIGALWFMAWRTATEKPLPPVANTNNENANIPSDFSRSGTVTFNNPGLKPNTPYFVFEEPGSPALSKELSFDEDSICYSGAGRIPCLAMDISIEAAYGEQRVTVEGVSQPDGSLLIKMMSLEK